MARPENHTSKAVDLLLRDGTSHGVCPLPCGVRWWVVAAIVMLALVVRLLYLAETRTMPFVQHLIGDAAGYYEWAQRIADGDWIGRSSFYQAPLYPYSLAIVFRLFGESVATVRVVQAIGGAVAAGCMCVGAGRLLGGRVGIVAGVMLALYPPAIFFDGIVQKASLSCLVICFLFAAMTWCDVRRSVWRVFAVGVLSSLVVLVRENAMIWLPLLAVWIWLSGSGVSGRKRCVLLAGYAVGVCLVLVPVGVRNAATGGAFSLSTFQAGPNLYIGNHIGATGRYVPLVRGHETPEFERRDATLLAEQDVGHELSPQAVSRYWMNRALSDIRSDVPAWLRLMAHKALLVWNRYEVADYEDQALYEEYSILLALMAPFGHFGVLVPLAGAGIVATRRKWRGLWVYYAMLVAMAVAVAAFYIMARYRYPLVPLLIPFSAAGVLHLWDGIRARRLHELWPAVLTTVVLAIVSNMSLVDEVRLGAMSRMNLGVTLAKSGDYQEASYYLRQAVAGHPGSAEAHVNLALSLSMQGRFEESIGHYQAALRIQPGLIGVDYNLAVALERVGALDAAIHHYRRAVALSPDDEDARAALLRLTAR